MSDKKLTSSALKYKMTKFDSIISDVGHRYNKKVVRSKSLDIKSGSTNLLNENKKRLKWVEYFSNILSVVAERSPCKRLQVGCLLVKDNRIISQGYNGFLAGCIHESVIRDSHEKATIHAEQNAISDCAKRGVSCEGATAYITHYPCLDCGKLLLASGIAEIKYLTDYNNDELVEKFCKQQNCKIIKID